MERYNTGNLETMCSFNEFEQGVHVILHGAFTMYIRLVAFKKDE